VFDGPSHSNCFVFSGADVAKRLLYLMADEVARKGALS